MPIAGDQLRLLRTLRVHGVEFIAIGGVAAQVLGWDGATNDLDVSVAPGGDNLARFNRALLRLEARQTAVSPTGTVFHTRFGRLEVISRADGPGDYAGWVERARERPLPGDLTIMVAGADDILWSKEAAGRDKDLEALPSLRRAFIDRGHIGAAEVRGDVADANLPSAVASSDLVDRLGPPIGEEDPAGMIMWQDVAERIRRAEADPAFPGRDRLERDIERVRRLRRR